MARAGVASYRDLRRLNGPRAGTENDSLIKAVDDFGAGIKEALDRATAQLKKWILIMLVIHGIVVSGAIVALVKLI